MVNFDGVAIATIIFQHHSTILSFLECLESGLLPKGCLQPPLFYLKTHHQTQRKDKCDPDLSNGIITTYPVSLKQSNTLNAASPDPSVTVPHSSTEVADTSDNSTSHIWNQVFAVRCGSHPVPSTRQPTNGKKSSILMGEIPGKFWKLVINYSCIAVGSYIVNTISLIAGHHIIICIHKPTVTSLCYTV